MKSLPRKFLFAAAFLAALTGAPGNLPSRASEPPLLEKQVKSAFVVNFIQFIDWPQAAFSKPDDPIIIGVLDPNSLGDALAAAIENKTVRGRKLVIKKFTADTLGPCHLLIVGALPDADSQSALKFVAQSNVLTIGDSDSFTTSGGMIRFYQEDRKMRFEINQAAAQRAQLQISAKLLKLAKVVNY